MAVTFTAQTAAVSGENDALTELSVTAPALAANEAHLILACANVSNMAFTVPSVTYGPYLPVLTWMASPDVGWFPRSAITDARLRRPRPLGCRRTSTARSKVIVLSAS